MKSSLIALLCLAATTVLGDHHLESDETGFISLFDGKTLDGWKVSETPDSVKVEGGAIVTHGKRAHAFYTGTVGGAKFDDFELRLMVRASPNANGGVYIHTEYQEQGWPSKGYEIQVNNSHSDWRKSGSLYAVVDVKEEANKAKDGEWMHYRIRVTGEKITVWVNGVQTAMYKEKPGDERSKNLRNRFLLPEGGTIALQAHDPGSKVEYKNIRIKSFE